MELVPNVHVIKNSYVNLYLIVEDDGLTLIDAGLHQSGPRLALEGIKGLGRHANDVRRILITHSDGDHTGGAAELKRATGAQVLASANEGAMMALGKEGRAANGPLGWLAGGLAKMMMPIPAQAPDGVLEDDMVLPVLGGLKVVASPGHTPGHLAFFAPSVGVLFAGDALNTIGGKLRFMDGPFTWDYAKGKDSVRTLAALEPKWVACGHGRPLGGNLVWPT